MTKYVIDTVELKKRQYVIEAYTERAAIELMDETEPTLQEVLSDTIFNIHTINEYEYKSEYKREKKDHEGYQYDAFKDQDIYRDD